MRILQLHNHHASLGGAMEVLAHEGKLLAAAGHDVEEFTLPPAEQSGLSSVRAGAKAVWNVEAQRETTRRIKRFKPDVVHVHTPFPLMSPSVFRAAHAAGVPAVTTLHSYRWACVVGTCVRDGRICEDCVGSKLKLPGIRHACYHDSRLASTALTLGLHVHRAVGTTHRAVTRYLALTDFMRRLMIRDGYPADRVMIKPNSVPDPGAEGRRPTQDREIFFAGRLIEIKGVRTMLDAWSRVPNRAEAGMRLVIAGDGELRPLVEERVAADDTITFLGWLGEDDVMARMRDAEVVMVPSQWYEGGAPLVVLRALAVGTPLLLADLENFSKEALDDGVAWSFSMGSVDSLTEQLKQIVANPERSAALRPLARQSYLDRYSPQVDLVRLETLYADVTR